QRLPANSTRLGFHPVFSPTFTLPRLIGQQKANLMFYTGRRIGGEQAVEWGLAGVLAALGDLAKEAMQLARGNPRSPPPPNLATPETMPPPLPHGAEAATE